MSQNNPGYGIANNVARHGVTEFLRAFENVGATFYDIENDFLIVLDEHGDVLRVNPAFERMLHRAEQDVIGRPIMVFVHPDDLAHFLRAFQDVQKSQPFRLLHAHYGFVTVRLVAYRFRNTEQGQRGFLILRSANPNE